MMAMEMLMALGLQQSQIEQGAKPFRKTIQDKRGADYIQTETTQEVYSVLTLARGEMLAGYAYLKWNEDTLDIRDLHVAPRYGRLGLGDALLRRIVLWAGTAGKSKVWGGIVQKDMRESPFLLEWYQRHGFTVEAPEDRNFLSVENEYSVWLDVGNWQDTEPNVAEEPRQKEKQEDPSVPPSRSGKRKTVPKYKYPFGRD